MKTTIEHALEYTIKHQCIEFVVKRKLFFWEVRTISGGLCAQFLFKDKANKEADFLNAVFNHGYSVGCSAIIKTLI